MMGKRCHRYIVVGVERQALCIALGGLALVFECLGNRAEVGVKYSLYTFHPSLGEFFVGFLYDFFQVGCKYSVEFAVYVLVFAILQTVVYFFRHCAIALPHVGNVHSRAAGAEGGLAIHAHETLGLVAVALAHGKHLRDIKRVAAVLADFVFVERCAGEAPACSRFILVFYRGRGQVDDIGEDKGLCRVGG